MELPPPTQIDCIMCVNGKVTDKDGKQTTCASCGGTGKI